MSFDWTQYTREGAALALVLALIIFVVWLIRRFGWSSRSTVGGRQRRLRVIEVMGLDAKHRLVLVRRDEVDHLVLIGGASPLVIESGIRTSMQAPASSAPTPKMEPEPRL